MNLTDFAIGCDIEEIERFKNKTLENDEHFLRSLYTTRELDYCFSKGLPCQHLAVRFCAKESIYKALCALNITNIKLLDIEITNNHLGVPNATVIGHTDLSIKLSLSHTKTYATSYAWVYFDKSKK